MQIIDFLYPAINRVLDVINSRFQYRSRKIRPFVNDTFNLNFLYFRSFMSLDTVIHNRHKIQEQTRQ